MKRFVAFFLALLMSFLLPLPVLAEAYDGEEALMSPHIAVYNAYNGAFVYTKGANERVLPGVTAKLMTALVAYDYYEGALDSVVTVPKGALSGLSGTAVLNLKAGEQIPVQELLYAMLTAGMNDAAQTLALVIGGTMADFVSMMNRKAAELGAGDTLYLNATGFDNASAYTTAADTARIAAAFYENKILMEMASTRAHTVPATDVHGPVTIYTRNSLLTTQGGYYYKNAEGMCAGYTEAGGYTVVSASSDGAYPYICVAMGSEKSAAGRIGGYDDVKDLLIWAGDNFLERKVLDRSKILAELPVSAGKLGHVLIVPAETVYAFLDADTDLSAITLSVNLEHEMLTAPVKKDAIVGSLLVLLDGEPIASTHLVTKTAVKRSASGAFLLGVKAVITHPAFLIPLFLILLFGAFAIYRKNFKKKP